MDNVHCSPQFMSHSAGTRACVYSAESYKLCQAFIGLSWANGRGIDIFPTMTSGCGKTKVEFGEQGKLGKWIKLIIK